MNTNGPDFSLKYWFYWKINYFEEIQAILVSFESYCNDLSGGAKNRRVLCSGAMQEAVKADHTL